MTKIHGYLKKSIKLKKNISKIKLNLEPGGLSSPYYTHIYDFCTVIEFGIAIN